MRTTLMEEQKTVGEAVGNRSGIDGARESAFRERRAQKLNAQNRGQVLHSYILVFSVVSWPGLYALSFPARCIT